MTFFKADLVIDEVFVHFGWNISVFYSREREAAERKKKEENSVRNTGEKNKEKQVSIC